MRYPASIRSFHWSSAVLIIGLLILGIYMTPFDESDMAFSSSLYFWHKSFGMLALVVVLARVFNRPRHKLPALPSTMARHEQTAARIAHKALYALIVLVPVLGYVQSSAYEHSSGVPFFLFNLPELIPENEAIFGTANFLHEWLSYLLIALVVAHVLGALKHRFIDKENDVLGRML